MLPCIQCHALVTFWTKFLCLGLHHSKKDTFLFGFNFMLSIYDTDFWIAMDLGTGTHSCLALKALLVLARLAFLSKGVQITRRSFKKSETHKKNVPFLIVNLNFFKRKCAGYANPTPVSNILTALLLLLSSGCYRLLVSLAELTATERSQ